MKAYWGADKEFAYQDRLVDAYLSLEHSKDLDFALNSNTESNSKYRSNSTTTTESNPNTESTTNTESSRGLQSMLKYITYPRSLKTRFDIIVIDGILRNFCAKEIAHLINEDSKEGAIVILDNSDWHQHTAKYLRENLNLIQVDFHGFSPINAYTLTTSIFMTRNFAFKPIGGVEPHYSLAALHHSEKEAKGLF